jgi:hypothetical protein
MKVLDNDELPQSDNQPINDKLTQICTKIKAENDRTRKEINEILKNEPNIKIQVRNQRFAMMTSWSNLGIRFDLPMSWIWQHFKSASKTTIRSSSLKDQKARRLFEQLMSTGWWSD